MKTRRFLAALLGIVVAISSEGLSGTAYAAAADQTLATAIVEEADTTSDAVTDGIAYDAQSVTGEEALELSDESAVQDKTSAEGADETEEIILQDADAINAEYAGQEEFEPLGAGSDCFEVDADGVLKVKEGKSATGTVIIPADAKVIPKGILNKASITGVSFETGSQLVTIEAGAFEGSKITSIIIPQGVKEIKEATFKDVTTLTKVSFEQGSQLTIIGKEAFRKTALNAFAATYVTSIGDSAFDSCKSLANLDLPNVSTIGSSAFSGCSALTTVTFSKYVSSIGELAFSTTALKEADLSKSEDLTLGYGAFSWNTSLTKVVLPKDMSEIPDCAFAECSKLVDLTIGEGVESIGESAFENCKALTVVRIPESVYTINANAFAGCAALKTIIINYPTPDDGEFTMADSAFPMGKTGSDKKKTDTMKGYDGLVQEYATRFNYNYVTLFIRKNVKIYTGDDLEKKATVTANVSKDVAAGTEVKVTVTPKEGYVLDSISVEADTYTPISMIENNETNTVFSFIMPAEEPTVKPVMIKKDKAKSTPSAYHVTGINEYNPSVTKDGIAFDMSYRSALLHVTDGSEDLNPWFFTFSSSNSSVTINQLGEMLAGSKGASTITVKSKLNNKKIDIPVTVAKTADVERIQVNLPAVSKSARFSTETYVNPEDGEETEIPLVLYSKAALSTGSRTLKVSMDAFTDGEDRSLVVKSEWSTSSSAIAKVKNTTSKNNNNVITIQKGSMGDAVITVKVKKIDGSVTEDTTAKFIVRVMDTTPRISSKTIEVNSIATKGTNIQLTEVYGYKILDSSLSLHVGKQNGPICPDLEIAKIDGKYYIKNSTGEAFAKTYKDDKKIYITGAFEDDPNVTFAIELTSVTVTKNELNPTITMSGKINLFYKHSSDGGTVKLTQNIKTAEVVDMHLVCTTNKEKNKPFAEDDPFRDNFILTQTDNNHFLITRSETSLRKDYDKNFKETDKDALSGFLYIRYDGYDKVIWKSITIPTHTTTPEYVLDISGATISGQATGQVFYLHVVDKKTKKKVVSLANLDTNDAVSGALIGIGLSQGKDMFEEPDINEARATDYIVLKTLDSAPSGTAKIYIQDEAWSKPLKFDFKLNVAIDMPSVSFTTGTAQLNLALPGQAAVLTTKINRTDAAVTDFGEVKYTGGANLKNDAEDLIGAMQSTSYGGLEIGLPGDIKKGTYKFKVRPVITFEGSGAEINGPEVAFNVKVVSSTPAVSIKSKTFKLNARYPGDETVENTYKVTGLPTGASGEIVEGGDFEIRSKNTSGPDFGEIAELDFTPTALAVTLKDDAALYAGKKFSYVLTGLEAQCDGGNIALPNMNITLNLINSKPGATVKASGKINPVDANSFITYTTTLTNVTGTITDVDVAEWDTVRGVEYSDKDAQHFEVAQDAVNPKKVYLMLKEENRDTLQNNKKYKLTLKYEVNGSIPVEKIVNVTPKQSYPQLAIKVIDNKTTIYAGQAYDDRFIQISTLQKAPAKGKVALGSKITGVQFSKDTPASVKKAFIITEYDEDECLMTLQLANPWEIAAGKEYTLKFVPTYEGQAGNTTAAAFTVKVTVKK